MAVADATKALREICASLITFVRLLSVVMVLLLFDIGLVVAVSDWPALLRDRQGTVRVPPASPPHMPFIGSAATRPELGFISSDTWARNAANASHETGMENS